MPDTEAIRALARAENSFSTLQLDCVAEYDTARLQRALGGDAGTVALVGGDAVERFHHRWRVWWRRPDCWRDDILWDTGHSAVSVVCGGSSTSYLSALDRKRRMDPPRSLMRRFFAVFSRPEFVYQPKLADRLAQMPMVLPIGLTRGWVLQLLGSGEHAGRATLRIQATRGTSAAAFGMWNRVNEYVVDVDVERGILLRCGAMLDGTEASVDRAQSARFDEPIPDAIITDIAP
jgi:hypothetical protein